jgi:hypothetical protein
MRKNTLVKYIFSGLLVVLLLAQLIRPTKNLGSVETPEDITKVVKVPDNVMTVLKASCYDCHSNHTNYRWYHEIMPLGWWLNDHVKDGKKHFNFSEFAAYNKKRQDHKLEEVEDEVKEHEMPLESYTLFHKEAKLTEAQIQLIADWAKEARSNLH